MFDPAIFDPDIFDTEVDGDPGHIEQVDQSGFSLTTKNESD
jgi:hypothetical protein